MLPVKAGSNRELIAPPKPLVGIGKLQCDFRQQQKWPVKQINLILTPDLYSDLTFHYAQKIGINKNFGDPAKRRRIKLRSTKKGYTEKDF